jgi:hypothetical protein
MSATEIPVMVTGHAHNSLAQPLVQDGRILAPDTIKFQIDRVATEGSRIDPSADPAKLTCASHLLGVELHRLE